MSAAYRYGEKLALHPVLSTIGHWAKPLRGYAAMGAGIGAGVGGVVGFRTDDPNTSFEHHVGSGLQGAVVGAGVGALGGLGAGSGFRLFRPDLFKRLSQGPFPHAESILKSQEHRSNLSEYVYHRIRQDPSAEIPDAVWDAVGVQQNDPFAKAKAYAQKGYEAWSHPMTRAVAGAGIGKALAGGYSDMASDYKLQQLAARKGSREEPEYANENASLEAMKAQRHMGDYRSSRDGTGDGA